MWIPAGSICAASRTTWHAANLPQGGAGKTTLALHLAVADVQQGRNVAVLDLDPQGTAAGWGERRGSSAPVVLATAPSRLGAERERVAGAGADVVYLSTHRLDGRAPTLRPGWLPAQPISWWCRCGRPSWTLKRPSATLERIQAVTAARVVAVLKRLRNQGKRCRRCRAGACRPWRGSLPGADRSTRSVRSGASHRPGRAGIGADREGGRRDSAGTP